MYLWSHLLNASLGLSSPCGRPHNRPLYRPPRDVTDPRLGFVDTVPSLLGHCSHCPKGRPAIGIMKVRWKPANDNNNNNSYVANKWQLAVRRKTGVHNAGAKRRSAPLTSGWLYIAPRLSIASWSWGGVGTGSHVIVLLRYVQGREALSLNCVLLTQQFFSYHGGIV